MDIKEKLTAELTDAKLGKYETAVKNAVMKTICKFCEQNAEFKQAIEQSGKSLPTASRQRSKVQVQASKISKYTSVL